MPEVWAQIQRGEALGGVRFRLGMIAQNPDIHFRKHLRDLSLAFVLKVPVTPSLRSGEGKRHHILAAKDTILSVKVDPKHRPLCFGGLEDKMA